jgi:hypothetical protein
MTSQAAWAPHGLILVLNLLTMEKSAVSSQAGVLGKAREKSERFLNKSYQFTWTKNIYFFGPRIPGKLKAPIQFPPKEKKRQAIRRGTGNPNR